MAERRSICVDEEENEAAAEASPHAASLAHSSEAISS